MKAFILKYPLLLLLLFYFTTHLINLTAIPIFNDEAIYLDWGWRETHTPGMLYYSLYDGKQPMLMWLFGIAEHIFPDPLFAGRFVSVCAGAITLVGLYKLGMLLLNKQAAIIASFFYSSTPLMVFYDRMALMESAIGAVFVWMLYTFFVLVKTEHMKYAYIFGLITGIGFFIKSTPLLLFPILLLFLFGVGYFDNKPKLYSAALISSGMSALVDFLLFLNPQFWETLPMSNRYVFTLGDIISHPSSIFTNALQNSHTLLFLCTPLVIGFIVFGIIRMSQKGSYALLYAIVILILIGIETITVRSPLPRYLAPFIVPFFIPLAAGLHYKKPLYTRLALFCTALVPLCITSLLIFTPPSFIKLANSYVPSLDGISLSGHTNGFGIPEVVQFLQEKAQKEHALITYAQNTGNPESAITVYFQKTPIRTSYFDNALVGITDPKVTCLIFPDQKIYFVSRNDQQVGLDKFLVLVKKFPKPQGNDFIGVYTLKTQCTGKTQTIYLEKT